MNKLLGGQELARFEKNSSEEIRLTLQDFGYGRYVDICVWSKIRAGDSTPFTPTTNGFSLDVERLGDLRRAIDQALAVLSGVEAGQEARPQTSGHEGKGLKRGETGDL